MRGVLRLSSCLRSSPETQSLGHDVHALSCPSCEVSYSDSARMMSREGTCSLDNRDLYMDPRLLSPIKRASLPEHRVVGVAKLVSRDLRCRQDQVTREACLIPEPVRRVDSLAVQR